MHIGDLDGAGSQINKNNWQAAVSVLVVDQDGIPLADATVSGAWSGGYSGPAVCTTAGDGTCTITTDNIRKTALTATFTVVDVTHASLAYEAADNADPDGDSDGTSISVNRPW
jgi:serine protease AprX